MPDTRKRILERLRIDLIGPRASDEVIRDNPSDRYLTGILFPPRTGQGPEEDDAAETAEGNEVGEQEAVASFSAVRPSTAGVSFALRTAEGLIAAATFTISYGHYIGISDREEGENGGRRAPIEWQRVACSVTVPEVPLPTDWIDDINLAEYGAAGLTLHVRTSPCDGDVLVTAVLSNSNSLPEKPRRQTIEELSFFQVSLKAVAAGGAALLARPMAPNLDDEDGEAAALIYRGTADYAVGHTCSAEWELKEGQVTCVRTSWIPEACVPSTSADGDEIFRKLKERNGGATFKAAWLAEADDAQLGEALAFLPGAYKEWIDAEAGRVGGLADDHREQAEKHLARCRDALHRIEASVALITTDPDLRLAFRLANHAMEMQRQWSEGKPLEWRPFQLAFCLLSIPSTADPAHDDREVMDLLWFPTGGGKTEAYLLLTGFALFLRRLRGMAPGFGNGVTVLMRYTLRLLTVQQYQRAAALVCASELIRRDPPLFASKAAALLEKSPPISLGLWVGKDSSPNSVADAIEALRTDAASTPAQLKRCPCCKEPLTWGASPGKDQIWAMCRTHGCRLAAFKNLPIWTVDEDVYRELPSLLIGTADKFAQIVRSMQSGRLFGIGAADAPPDLIIQDELHLISGPLGTLAGIYEIAIDELCAWKKHRPKVIGSTATIRRASDQIRALFDREAFQFPPLGIDHDNSGFAVADANAPGRLYVGVTTAGRSAKFALQAVSASLLQSAADPSMPKNDRNYYWTLVAYFNSLRELGGALVLMQDDVAKSVEQFAIQRGEEPRASFVQTELTSRVESSRIPAILDQLLLEPGKDDTVDVALASNMISVGVDIPRLGVMVVNGQPKGIAEYIQSTSRVGRGKVPGLVVTVYNANKARDRSHYETFMTWHQSLYREVEATSVTPFAPRARDRALHAPLVAMARHLVEGLRKEPVNAAAHAEEIEALIDRIVARSSSIDPDEAAGVEKFLRRKLDEWCARGVVPKYWNDRKLNMTLLVSAEIAAELGARKRSSGLAWATPNSLRSVEASVEFILLNGLKVEDDE